MSTGVTVLITATLALVSAFAAILTARTARRANAAQHEVALSTEARGWTKQAQDDAAEAKSDAAEARREARKAINEAHEAEIALREVTAQTGALMRWIEHTVRMAHDETISDSRFREIVNGGPPELNALRSRLPE